MDSKKNIFAIYTGQDSGLALNLLHRMKSLEMDFNVWIWQDDPIYPGQPWKPQSIAQLDQADIFLLLVSDAFMHSEFVKQDKFKMIIDRHKAGKAIVIPVLLDNCPWDIDFKSDDYNFNFKELQVLPVGEKPISDWGLLDQPFKHVTDYLRGTINSFTENIDKDLPNENLEKKTIAIKKEEQLTINFTEESEAIKVGDKEKRLREEAEAKRKTEEEKRLKKEAKTKERIEEENRLKEEVKVKKRAEAEGRLKEETEIKRKAVEEERRVDELDAKKRAQQEARRKEAALAKKRIEEENSITEEECQSIHSDKTIEFVEERPKGKSGTLKKNS